MKMSRQREYQLRMEQQGRCTGCGKTPIIKRGLCEYHLAKRRQYGREKYRRTRTLPIRHYTRSTPDVEPMV